jgi:DNA-binding LacI/PurR family transcriptional regulator
MAGECARAAGLEMDVALHSVGRVQRGTSRLSEYIYGHEQGFGEWLEENEPPTAVIAAGEREAFGVCRALHAAGLHVPEDVSVATYDDVRAELCEPPLTVVSQSLVGIGEVAADLALRVKNKPKALQQLLEEPVWVPSELVVRDSTGPCRRDGERTETEEEGLR